VDAVGVIGGAQLVVNATTIGLHDERHPMDLALVAPASAVLDLVYRPGGTAFVRALRARGQRADDGLGMLVEQGALAFERWLGHPPDRSVMWRSLDGRSAPRPSCSFRGPAWSASARSIEA